jgi:hypothetical protein
MSSAGFRKNCASRLEAAVGSPQNEFPSPLESGFYGPLESEWQMLSKRLAQIDGLGAGDIQRIARVAFYLGAKIAVRAALRGKGTRIVLMSSELAALRRQIKSDEVVDETDQSARRISPAEQSRSGASD